MAHLIVVNTGDEETGDLGSMGLGGQQPFPPCVPHAAIVENDVIALFPPPLDLLPIFDILADVVGWGYFPSDARGVDLQLVGIYRQGGGVAMNS